VTILVFAPSLVLVFLASLVIIAGFLAPALVVFISAFLIFLHLVRDGVSDDRLAPDFFFLHPVDDLLVVPSKFAIDLDGTGGDFFIFFDDDTCSSIIQP